MLADADRLLAHLDTLPDRPGPDDPATPWNVREIALQTAARAARDLRRWERALDYTARMRASMQRRGAGAYEVAATSRFGDYGPLLELGRWDDAARLLADCQRVFTDAGNVELLGRVFSARAELASRRGQHDEAARLQTTALRLGYTRPDPGSVAASHHNLADHLAATGAGGPAVLAHRLAAALLYQLTGTTSASHANTLRALAADLRAHPDLTPPATVTTVAALVETTDGIGWAALVDALAPDRQTADTTLTQILDTARTLPPPDQDAEPDSRPG